MAFDFSPKFEYGTFLEYIYKGKLELQRNEFWGDDHSAKAFEFFKNNNLKELTFTHKFGPLQKQQ